MRIVWQPIIDMRDEHVLGYEALARFDDGRSPDVVFAEAWQRGCGLELEREAVRLALSEADQLVGGLDLYVSVNVSPQTLCEGVEALVSASSLHRDQIAIEITEHAQIDALALYKALAPFRDSKGLIALDDVGTGYSGLWHISQVDPHLLKLDRFIVAGIDTDPAKRAIARAITALARDMRATVIAEGVEREEERDWLLAIGLTVGQGHLFCSPAPVADHLELLELQEVVHPRRILALHHLDARERGADLRKRAESLAAGRSGTGEGDA
ncbi:MAG: EAL domain-containing protein [Actinomycetota bacterium]|nr:EAL domain-containing protein [Actinomycetota bacterium]